VKRQLKEQRDYKSQTGSSWDKLQEWLMGVIWKVMFSNSE